MPSLKLQFPMPASEAVHWSGGRGEVCLRHDGVLVPALPSLPAPGEDLPLPSVADLAHLTHFSLTSGAHNFTINASSTTVNRLPASFTAPSFPFVVWIPTSSNDTILTSVTSAPSTLTHPNHTLSSILPISHSAAPVLSSLISRTISLGSTIQSSSQPRSSSSRDVPRAASPA
ncbi:hypothetical protein EDB86DRAFT_3082908 [Lactarius hatsudake]|nr:hypothetical protein EDB86DRAFT_3082908 [Lactarius hatsudake]